MSYWYVLYYGWKHHAKWKRQGITHMTTKDCCMILFIWDGIVQNSEIYGDRNRLVVARHWRREGGEQSSFWGWQNWLWSWYTMLNTLKSTVYTSNGWIVYELCLNKGIEKMAEFQLLKPSTFTHPLLANNTIPLSFLEMCSDIFHSQKRKIFWTS